jgi:hypothetical protein
MTKKEFMNAFMPLLEIYKNELSDIALKLYFEVINETLTLQEFEKASKEILLTRKYSNFPAPAEFIEIAKGSKENSIEMQTQEALMKFKEAVRKARSVKFDDIKIHYVIKLIGGWSYVLKSNPDNLKWIYKDFEEIYRNVITTNKKMECFEDVLYTESDLANIKNGFAILPPLQMGSDKQCKSLLKM